MKKIVVSGKTVEEAVKAGLAQLGAAEDRAVVRVLEQPAKGLFGLIGSKEAKVELELIPDPIEETIAFLQDVFSAMEMQVEVEQGIDEDGAVLLQLKGDDLGILIGRRGQTLDALQYLTNIVVNRHSSTHLRLVLDAENFRERRRKTLQDLASRLSERVVRTKREVVLEPMSAQDRKIIHYFLQNNTKVRTYSKGDEPFRRIVIALK